MFVDLVKIFSRMIAETPKPPYYAVIFTSTRTEVVENYKEMNEAIEEAVKDADVFLGVEACREEVGISVSYWKDLESIRKWKNNPLHSLAKEKGKSAWFATFKTRIAKVEMDYDFL